MSAVPPIYNYKLHYPPKITIFPPSTIMYYILLCIISVIRNFGNNIMIKTKTKNRKLKTERNYARGKKINFDTITNLCTWENLWYHFVMIGTCTSTSSHKKSEQKTPNWIENKNEMQNSFLRKKLIVLRYLQGFNKSLCDWLVINIVPIVPGYKRERPKEKVSFS